MNCFLSVGAEVVHRNWKFSCSGIVQSSQTESFRRKTWLRLGENTSSGAFFNFSHYKNEAILGTKSCCATADQLVLSDLKLQAMKSTYHENFYGPERIKSLTFRKYEGLGNDDEPEMQILIRELRTKLQRFGDGETLPSAYDTSWVARVPAVDGSDGPQFPQTLEWIINNQLPDGSWGEHCTFLLYDRVLNTVACITALQKWNVGNTSIIKGLQFLRTNVDKLKEEESGLMLCGFEIVFTSLLDEARSLGLQLPYDHVFVEHVAKAGEEKLRRISLEDVHMRATTLLYSLEGLQKLIDWKKVMKLQSPNGSFLSSPAATACALMHTGDRKCLDFLTSTLASFGNNSVPCHYPIDLFERLWVVDTLQRLGIERFFRKEIKEVLDYVYRYWTPQGIGWARESSVKDIDDTSMAFRLLRLNGYDISADVFNCFRKGNEFFCFPGEKYHGISEMLNLYRASQVRFPGETILEEAHRYSRHYLQNVLASGDSLDKWSLKKDLQGEVADALKIPWERTAPLVEHRAYMERYGIADVWLAKTVYRLPSVNNSKLLHLAKRNFNRCQAQYCKEIQLLLRWWVESRLGGIPHVRQRPVESFFAIAISMYEPEFSGVRLAYAKTSILAVVLEEHAHTPGMFEDHSLLLKAVKRWEGSTPTNLSERAQIIFNALYGTINDITERASQLQGRDVSEYIRKHWEALIESQLVEARWAVCKHIPTFNEYMEHSLQSIAIPAIIMSSVFFCGEDLPDDALAQLDLRSQFLRKICITTRLTNDLKTYKGETADGDVACSINCYVKENPGAGEVEGIEHLKAVNEKTVVELTWEYLRRDSVNTRAPIAKRLAFGAGGVMNFLYHVERERVGNRGEMEKYVDSILFHELPMHMHVHHQEELVAQEEAPIPMNNKPSHS